MAGAILAQLEGMIASGQILPIRFPDPGKPEGIRTYRKPVMTMRGIQFRYSEVRQSVGHNPNRDRIGSPGRPLHPHQTDRYITIRPTVTSI